MLITTNPTGWSFEWPERSDFIEVYHKNASHADQPVEVLYAGDLRYNESELKKIANETPDYGRTYV